MRRGVLVDLVGVNAQFVTSVVPAAAEGAHEEQHLWPDPYDQPAPWREWARMLLALLLAGLVFYPALTAGWCWKDPASAQMDDVQSTWNGLWLYWRHPHIADVFRPVAFTSYWIEYAGWDGANAFGYHALGVALHLLNALLVWRILRRLQVKGSLFVACLFAMHPITVQAVTWITQQPIVLSSFFALASTLLWLRMLRIEPPPAVPMPEIEVPEWRRYVAYLFCLGFFVAGLLASPMICALPVVFVLIARWKREHLTRRQKMALVPFVVFAIAVIALAIWNLSSSGGEDRWTFSPILRLQVAGHALWFYVIKIALPWPLLFVYSKWPISAVNPLHWLFPLGACAIAIAVWRYRDRLPRGVVVAVATFALAALPWPLLMNLAKAPSYVADYQIYLASIAALAVIGSGLAHWVERARMVVPARYVFAILMLLGLGAMTWKQASLYASEQSLWQHTLSHNPDSPTANLELGSILIDRQKFDDAEMYLARATALRPTDMQAMLLYGTALERESLQIAEKDHATSQKKLQQAQSLYTDWRNRYPKKSAPVRCLAGIENLRGNRAGAIAMYNQALAIDPKDDIAENNLATALAREGRVDEALDHYARAIAINPHLVQAHLNMAGLLFGMRKNSQAFEHIESALKADRNNYDAYMSAGGVCMQMKLFNDASRMFRRAAELRNDSPTAWNALGCALAAQNHLDEAIECFGRALDLKPEYEDARANLNSARKQRG